MIIPNAGTWAEDYYTVEDDVFVIDLKKIFKDWGFVRLHSVKGPSYNTNAILYSIEAEKAAGGETQRGWTNILTNSDMEGDDVSSFITVLRGDNGDGDVTYPAVIEEGVGVNNSRGIAIKSMENAPQTWSTQLFVKLPELLPAGTEWRFSMDVTSDRDAQVSVAGHSAPRSWACGGNDISSDFADGFTTNSAWQTITAKGTIDQTLVDKKFQSICFDLNNDQTTATQYYFDNIVFEVFKVGTAVEFYNDIIKVDFGFETNIPELVKKGGKRRLLYPVDCVKVTVNGEPMEVLSVEAFADGRFYIFVESSLEKKDEIEVAFTNPNDAAYQIKFTAGPNPGSVVADFTEIAEENEEVEQGADVYPWDMETPIVLKANPEDGSFNLPNSIKEFELTFDKVVDASALKATLNGKALTVNPAEGLSEKIILKREGDDLPTGKYKIHVWNIYPEFSLDESIYGDTTYYVGIGKTEYDPNDQPKDMVPDYFATTPVNYIPEGWYCKYQGNDRPAGSDHASDLGARMFDFAAGGDFTKGFYFREGYIEYGSTEGYPLTLEAGKRYDITFNTAMWQSSGNKMRFEIFTAGADGQAGEVAFVQVVDNAPDLKGSRDAVNGSAQHTIQFRPSDSGNYILRWTSSGSETGDPAYMEMILAKPAMMYMPEAMGLEETILLNTALENAKAVQEENQNERYNGAAYDALAAAVVKYDAEKDGYTGPSMFKDAAAVLNAAAQAMKDHRQLCDNYDTQIKKALDVVRQNAQNKYAGTDLYAQLKTIVAKYNGSSELVNDAPEGEAEHYVASYTYDVLKDDAALTAAIEELTTIANTTSLLFTEGVSKTGSTGVMVLVDRIRMGAETLKSLGVAEDDALIVAANNALTDDDNLADQIKARIKEVLYGQLKNPDHTLFPAIYNEETDETTYQSYDMSVFIKNPNLYTTKADRKNLTQENAPGWTITDGSGYDVSWTTGWSQVCTDEIPADAMLSNWTRDYSIEQEITDLPAGVYTLKVGMGERNDEVTDRLIFVKTTATGDEGLQENAPIIGQNFPVSNVAIENLVVTDGFMLIGAKAGNNAHTFLNNFELSLTAPATGFDYATAYETGIETLDAPAAAKVRAIELFDLNGRRLGKAQKGITIVKKVMSDGSIKTEKVIVK